MLCYCIIYGFINIIHITLLNIYSIVANEYYYENNALYGAILEYRKKCTSYNNLLDKDTIDNNHLGYHIHTNRILTDGMYVSANENIGIQNSMVISKGFGYMLYNKYTYTTIAYMRLYSLNILLYN